ncbi:hypothetical protein NMG60_11005100 [Bertholletia excelsa]
MDWNSRTPSGWDWESLPMFSGRIIEAAKEVQLLSSEIEREGVGTGCIYSSVDADFSGSDLGYHSSSKSSLSASLDSSWRGGVKAFRTLDGQREKFAGMSEIANSSTSKVSLNPGEPTIGLKLGKRTYFEDLCGAATKTPPFSIIPTPSAMTAKRSRMSYQSTQIPRCQVEGCNLDLKSAKDYHRRHKICESHSKSPRVTVAGKECRFCQQCSRFHDLSEFDDKKRSCRRRLSDHNARRRRPRPHTIQFNSAGLASSLYDGRQQMNLLLNGHPAPVTHPGWKNACNFKMTQSGDSLNRSKAAGIDRQPHWSCDEMPYSISMLHLDADKILSFQSTTSRVLNRDLPCALSLLSTNSRGLGEPESSSVAQFMHVNQDSMTQPETLAGPQNEALASSKYMRVLPPASVSLIPSWGLHNNSSNQFKEFQLFKSPFEPGCFNSNQIDY